MKSSSHSFINFVNAGPILPPPDSLSQQIHIFFAVYDVEEMITTDYQFERSFQQNQSWLASIEHPNSPLCVNFMQTTWYEDADIEVINVPPGEQLRQLRTYDNDYFDKLDATADHNPLSEIQPDQMPQYDVKNQMQNQPFPWNECEIQEPEVFEDVKIRRETLIDGKVPIPFGTIPKTIDCNYERVKSGFIELSSG